MAKGFFQVENTSEKWVGGLIPNTDFLFTFGYLVCFFVFLVLFFVAVHVSKKLKKWIGGFSLFFLT